MLMMEEKTQELEDEEKRREEEQRTEILEEWQKGSRGRKITLKDCWEICNLDRKESSGILAFGFPLKTTQPPCH